MFRTKAGKLRIELANHMGVLSLALRKLYCVLLPVSNLKARRTFYCDLYGLGGVLANPSETQAGTDEGKILV